MISLFKLSLLVFILVVILCLKKHMLEALEVEKLSLGSDDVILFENHLMKNIRQFISSLSVYQIKLGQFNQFQELLLDRFIETFFPHQCLKNFMG